MKTSTLLVLLGMSIIAVSMITFASFILSSGLSTPSLPTAGSVLSVALLMGLSQILIGRALRPAGAETETERTAKKDRQKLSPSSLSLSRSRNKTEEEEPRVISVDDQEPAAWLKTTLERLAEQGSSSAEETVTPAELSADARLSSRPKIEDRPKPASTPTPLPPPKVKGSLITTPTEYSRIPSKKEPVPEVRPKSRFEEETEPEPAILQGFERASESAPAEQDENRPGVRRLKEMEITFVERDGITFLEVGTGIHERYPCEDQALIDYAWRALVRGLKVNVEVESGRVTKLTPAA